MTKTSNPKIPQDPPQNWFIVHSGDVKPTDKLWTPESESFEHPSPKEINLPVTCFKRVIRAK